MYLIDADGTTQSQFNYPGYESEWDKVYTPGESGTLVKVDPNPATTQGACTVGDDNNNGGGKSKGDNGGGKGNNGGKHITIRRFSITRYLTFPGSVAYNY